MQGWRGATLSGRALGCTRRAGRGTPCVVCLRLDARLAVLVAARVQHHAPARVLRLHLSLRRTQSQKRLMHACRHDRLEQAKSQLDRRLEVRQEDAAAHQAATHADQVALFEEHSHVELVEVRAPPLR